jgi:hypothetical protein
MVVEEDPGNENVRGGGLVVDAPPPGRELNGRQIEEQPEGEQAHQRQGNWAEPKKLTKK